jgi:hypothetical protein
MHMVLQSQESTIESVLTSAERAAAATMVKAAAAAAGEGAGRGHSSRASSSSVAFTSGLQPPSFAEMPDGFEAVWTRAVELAMSSRSPEDALTSVVMAPRSYWLKKIRENTIPKHWRRFVSLLRTHTPLLSPWVALFDSWTDSKQQGQLRAVRSRLRANSTFNGVEDWQELFRLADQDGNGVIDEDEFVQVCHMTSKGAARAFAVPDAQLRALFKHLDMDGDGGIQYEEFELFLRGKRRKTAVWTVNGLHYELAAELQRRPTLPPPATDQHRPPSTDGPPVTAVASSSAHPPGSSRSSPPREHEYDSLHRQIARECMRGMLDGAIAKVAADPAPPPPPPDGGAVEVGAHAPWDGDPMAQVRLSIGGFAPSPPPAPPPLAPQPPAAGVVADDRRRRQRPVRMAALLPSGSAALTGGGGVEGGTARHLREGIYPSWPQGQARHRSVSARVKRSVGAGAAGGAAGGAAAAAARRQRLPRVRRPTSVRGDGTCEAGEEGRWQHGPLYHTEVLGEGQGLRQPSRGREGDPRDSWSAVALVGDVRNTWQAVDRQRFGQKVTAEVEEVVASLKPVLLPRGQGGARSIPREMVWLHSPHYTYTGPASARGSLVRHMPPAPTERELQAGGERGRRLAEMVVVGGEQLVLPQISSARRRQ